MVISLVSPTSASLYTAEITITVTFSLVPFNTTIPLTSPGLILLISMLVVPSYSFENVPVGLPILSFTLSMVMLLVESNSTT